MFLFTILFHTVHISMDLWNVIVLLWVDKYIKHLMLIIWGNNGLFEEDCLLNMVCGITEASAINLFPNLKPITR